MPDHTAILIAAIVGMAIFGLTACRGWYLCAMDLRAMRTDRNAWMRSAETHAAARREVEPREALFRQALGFYARDTHWRPMRTRRHSITFRDRGAVARAALRGEDIDQIMQQLQLAQTAPVVVPAPDTAAAGPEVAATSEPEQAAA
jgi:hypothetical protein